VTKNLIHLLIKLLAVFLNLRAVLLNLRTDFLNLRKIPLLPVRRKFVQEYTRLKLCNNFFLLLSHFFVVNFQSFLDFLKNSIFILHLIFLSNDVEELLTSELFVSFKQLPVVSKHTCALNKRITCLTFLNLRKRFSHNSNDHVQKANIGDKGSQEEHEKDHLKVRIFFKSFSIPISQAEHVLINYSINKWIIKNAIDHFASASYRGLKIGNVRIIFPDKFILFLFQIQYEKSVRKAKQNDKIEDHKSFNVT